MSNAALRDAPPGNLARYHVSRGLVATASLHAIRDDKRLVIGRHEAVAVTGVDHLRRFHGEEPHVRREEIVDSGVPRAAIAIAGVVHGGAEVSRGIPGSDVAGSDRCRILR